MHPSAKPRKLTRTIQAALLSLTVTTTFVHAAHAAESSLNSSATHSYQLPAGPLGSNLVNVAASAGIALSFDPSLTAGLSSPALTGNYTVREALTRLLAGSGLELVANPDGSYSLKKATPAPTSRQVEAVTTLAEVEVAAAATSDDHPAPYAGGQVARGGRVGFLGNMDVMDTPFNITAYTQKTVQDQQARTVADVVLNDPSVRNTNPTAGRFDQFSIRGLRILNSDIAFGGLYGMLSTYSVAVETAERIEILKGPNALLNGMSPNGGVGGAINFVPKRAGNEPLTQFTASYISEGEFGGHIDLGRRFGPDDSFGVRFNGVLRGGDLAVENQEAELGMGELALDYRGERARFSVDAGHQERDVDAPTERVLLATGLEVPKAPDAEDSFIQPWSYVKARDTHLVLRGEYDIADNLTAYAATGKRNSNYDFLRNFSLRVTDNAGRLTYTSGYYMRDEQVWSSEAGLRTNFDTGPINHAVTLGASQFRLEVHDGSQNFAGTYVSNLYNPVTLSKQARTLSDDDLAKTGETELGSLALSDTLSMLDDQLQLTLGVRRQRVRVEGFNGTTGARTANYKEYATTPAVGVVYKLTPGISLYANHIEALSQGPTAPLAAVNRNEVLPPIHSRQVEGGAKFDFGKFATTVSVFRIKQPSAFTDSNGVFGINGEQRNEGLEWNVFGEPVTGVRVLGGVMLLDGELVKTAGGTNDGNRPVGVSTVNFNLGGEWDPVFLPGVTLTARMIHTGSAYLDVANTQRVDDWTRYDIGARYAAKLGNHPVTFRASVENVLDRDYWTATEFGLSIGAPRTVLMSATVDF
jgi:iron complex outermembrane recepter protein